MADKKENQKPRNVSVQARALEDIFKMVTGHVDPLPEAKQKVDIAKENYTKQDDWGFFDFANVPKLLTEMTLSQASKGFENTNKKIEKAKAGLASPSEVNKIKAQATLDKLGYVGEPQTNNPAGFNFDLSKLGAGVKTPTIVPQQGQVSPQTGPANFDLDAYKAATIAAESGGDYTAKSKAGALGAYQVMPETGKALATQLGLTWQPKLMTANTPEAKAYQDAIGNAALAEAWKAGNGDPIAAATYYHAGPNPALAGPITRAYATKVAQSMGAVQAGSGTGPVQLNPNTLASFIPNPQQISPMTLPEAPVLQAPPEMAPLNKLDPNLLARLQEAYKASTQRTATDDQNIKKREGETAKDYAIRYGVAGAPLGPLGILGGGLLGYFLGKGQAKQGDINERIARGEQEKQNAIKTAMLNFDFGEANTKTDNINLDRTFTNQSNVIETKNQNATNKFNRDVKQTGMNFDVEQFNKGSQNAADLTRGKVKIDASQSNADAYNRQLLTDTTTQAKTAKTQLNPMAVKILSDIGINPKSTDDDTPALERARNAAEYISANNPSGALNLFADEIIESGGAQNILNDTDFETYTKYVSEKNIAAAKQLVLNAINSDRSATLQNAKAFGELGNPVAMMIAKYSKQDEKK